MGGSVELWMYSLLGTGIVVVGCLPHYFLGKRMKKKL
jgi:membrane protein DedA with SNARE-associated domain